MMGALSLHNIIPTKNKIPHSYHSRLAFPLPSSIPAISPSMNRQKRTATIVHGATRSLSRLSSVDSNMATLYDSEQLIPTTA